MRILSSSISFLRRAIYCRDPATRGNQVSRYDFAKHIKKYGIFSSCVIRAARTDMNVFFFLLMLYFRLGRTAYPVIWTHGFPCSRIVLQVTYNVKNNLSFPSCLLHFSFAVSLVNAIKLRRWWYRRWTCTVNLEYWSVNWTGEHRRGGDTERTICDSSDFRVGGTIGRSSLRVVHFNPISRLRLLRARKVCNTREADVQTVIW